MSAAGVDLTTTVAGLRLRNPVVAAASEVTMTEAGILDCLSAGAGAVVAKSVNELPEAAAQFDIADYVLLDEDLEPVPWELASGGETLLNRSGLVQTPLEEWLGVLERCQRAAAASGAAVIGSVTVASADGAARIGAAMSEVVPAVELNVGAPHGREAAAVRQLTEADGVRELVATVRAAVDGALLVKLPGQSSDVVALARAARDAGADAVGLIGRLTGFVPDLDTWNPQLGSWGAVGGRWMLPVSLYWVSKCWRELDVDLVGTNGARTGRDVARFLLSGARAVELASLPMARGAGALAEVVAELTAYLRDRGVRSLDGMIGASVGRARTYAEIPPLEPRPWPWSPSPRPRGVEV